MNNKLKELENTPNRFNDDRSAKQLLKYYNYYILVKNFM